MDFDQGKITIIHDLNTNFCQMEERLESLKEKYPAVSLYPLDDAFNKPNFKTIIQGLNECHTSKKSSLHSQQLRKKNMKKPCN
jgi:hypothetical protein